MKNLISVGEAMVEMSPQSLPGHFHMGFAGDTLNTAWYAIRLSPNWNVSFMTAIGRDKTSDQLVSFLADAGIDTTHVQRHDDRTIGLYMIALEKGERHFSYWRGQSAARQLAADRARLDEAFAQADLIYFSGITLAVQEGDGRENLLAAIAAARSAGCQIVFDTNLRPALWDDNEQMCDWVSKAAEVSDMILPSHDDEAVHFGDADPEATRDRYVAAGATTVVVKNGPRTIHYQHEGRQGVVQPAIVSDVVDTTAAGDSFNAGLLAAYVEGAAIPEAIRAASNVARRVIKGRGALVPIK
ncbi:sugar kinase [Yoonia sp. SS1-5]|uniref:Sugar kinase n=1 Tax=Yoonia rhodophyticola TaxID=3137370 RepID=A0AAN0MMB3_9RHOB